MWQVSTLHNDSVTMNLHLNWIGNPGNLKKEFCRGFACWKVYSLFPYTDLFLLKAGDDSSLCYSNFMLA